MSNASSLASGAPPAATGAESTPTKLSLLPTIYQSSAQGNLAVLPPICEGMVMKKADDSKFRLLNMWKKRFLRLDSAGLAYAVSAEEVLIEEKRKGYVQLTLTMECVKGHETFGFDVFESGGKAKVLMLRLKAMTQAEADVWIKRINDVINSMKPNGAQRERTETATSTPNNEPVGMVFKDPPVATVDKDAPLTDEDIEHIRKKLLASSYSLKGTNTLKLFEQIDKDHSEQLDLAELSSVVKRTVPNVTDKQIQSFVKVIDKDGNNFVDKMEFVDFLNRTKVSFTDHKRYLVDPEVSNVQDAGDSRLFLDDLVLNASLCSSGSRNASPGSSSRRSHGSPSIRRTSTSPYSKLYVSDREIDYIRSKLKSCAYSMYGCDTEALFSNIDMDSNGLIDIVELTVAINKLVPKASSRVIRALLQTVNAAEKGCIDKDEFIQMLNVRSDYSSSESASENVGTKLTLKSWKPGDAVPRLFHKEKPKGVKFLGVRSPLRLNSPRRASRRASMSDIIDLKSLVLPEKLDLSLRTKKREKIRFSPKLVKAFNGNPNEIEFNAAKIVARLNSERKKFENTSGAIPMFRSSSPVCTVSRLCAKTGKEVLVKKLNKTI